MSETPFGQLIPSYLSSGFPTYLARHGARLPSLRLGRGRGRLEGNLALLNCDWVAGTWYSRIVCLSIAPGRELLGLNLLALEWIVQLLRERHLYY